MRIRRVLGRVKFLVIGFLAVVTGSFITILLSAHVIDQARRPRAFTRQVDELTISHYRPDNSEHHLPLSHDASRIAVLNYSEAGHQRKERALQWGNKNLLNKTRNPRYRAFEPIITDAEFAQLMELMGTFMRACEEHALFYILYGGTMIGSFRHGGMIPWDDDVDVLMHAKDRARIADVLGRMPGYRLHAPKHMQWKFYSERQSSEKPWPFIDIFFYIQNSTHLWDMHYQCVFEISDVFPVSRQPYFTFKPFGPGKTRAFLNKMFTNVTSRCETSYYSHKRKSLTNNTVTVPCRQLVPFFPFVINNTLHYPVVTNSFEAEVDELS